MIPAPVHVAKRHLLVFWRLSCLHALPKGPSRSWGIPAPPKLGFPSVSSDEEPWQLPPCTEASGLFPSTPAQVAPQLHTISDCQYSGKFWVKLCRVGKGKCMWEGSSSAFHLMGVLRCAPHTLAPLQMQMLAGADQQLPQRGSLVLCDCPYSWVLRLRHNLEMPFLMSEGENFSLRSGEFGIDPRVFSGLAFLWWGMRHLEWSMNETQTVS